MDGDKWFDRAYAEVNARTDRLTGDWRREAERTRRLLHLALDRYVEGHEQNARDLIASLRGALVYMERTTKSASVSHASLPKVTDPGYDPNDTPKVSGLLRPRRR